MTGEVGCANCFLISGLVFLSPLFFIYMLMSLPMVLLLHVKFLMPSYNGGFY